MYYGEKYLGGQIYKWRNTTTSLISTQRMGNFKRPSNIKYSMSHIIRAKYSTLSKPGISLHGFVS